MIYVTTWLGLLALVIFDCIVMPNLLAFMATVILMKVLKSLATQWILYLFEHFKCNMNDDRPYKKLTDPYNNEAEVGMVE